ncbi:MAG TPA: hypothetical protein VF571_04900 [Pyrinomonadaceae bacterium]|jgi:hypothetical protein
MDLIKELQLTAKNILIQRRIKHFGVSGWEIVCVFLNYKSKLISQIPRKVIMSKKIQPSSYDKTTKIAFETIKRKFLNGEDVNPHLSRFIFDGKFTDFLFADWGIYHLHLNTRLDNDKRLIARSENVLFLKIFGDTVYFIDIGHHGKNAPYAFAQFSLLRTIADEFPWIIEPDKIKDAIDIEDEINDPEKIKEMREEGVNLLHKINGNIYLPLNYGITSVKSSVSASVAVRMQVNKLYYLVKDAEKYITENRTQINEHLSRNENYNPNKACFRIDFAKDDFVIYEESTKEPLIQLKV